MKKIITLFTLTALALCILSPASTAAAQAACIVPSSKEIVFLENGDYLETVIADVPTISSGISTFSTTKTVTKTKTTYYKNSNGVTLWSVSIRASFTYDGSTSRCTSYSHSTTCPAQSWRIKSVSSSKCGNSATAVATATHFIGNTSNDYKRSITIYCSNNGTVS